MTSERFFAILIVFGIAIFVFPLFAMLGALGVVPYVLLVGAMAYLFWPFRR